MNESRQSIGREAYSEFAERYAAAVRFGESRGKLFFSEADALMGGFSAGQRIVEDLFTS